MNATKIMDHVAYPKSLKGKTYNELDYIIRDAKAAMAANPENPNNGYYQDEVCYCANELARRRNLRWSQLANTK